MTELAQHSSGTRKEDDSADSLVEMYRSHPSPGYRDKIEFAEKRMELRLYSCGIQPEDYSEMAILDAGCGTGEYACWFASKGATVVGLDLSTEALAQARRYAENHTLGDIRFQKGSVLDLPFDSERFDLVYCTGVLHHTPAPFRGFQELCRVAQPNGQVLISLYHSWGFLPRYLRWSIARLLSGKDLDRRVAWGRRLFPFTTRRLTDKSLEDPESPLYDYFAAPRQSTHRVGEVLRWFDRTGLEFQGSFPPIHLSNYPTLFQRKEYKSIEQELKSPLHALVSHIGPAEKVSRDQPDTYQRLIVEALWLMAGVEIFSISGTKDTQDQSKT